MLLSCAHFIPALEVFKFALASPIAVSVFAPASVTTDWLLLVLTSDDILPEPSVEAIPALLSSALSEVLASAMAVLRFSATLIVPTVLPATNAPTTPCVNDLLRLTVLPNATSVRMSVKNSSPNSPPASLPAPTVPDATVLPVALLAAPSTDFVILLIIAMSVTPPTAIVIAEATWKAVVASASA